MSLIGNNIEQSDAMSFIESKIGQSDPAATAGDAGDMDMLHQVSMLHLLD